MATIRYSIDGQYEDAHPYMDYLFLLTPSYRLVVVEWSRWISTLAQRLDEPDLHQRLLSRNDLLGVDSHDGTQADPDVRELGSIPGDMIIDEIDLGITSCVDWTIYNRTLYYATSEEVWMRPLVINGTFEGTLEAQRITETTGLQLRARHGVIAVSRGKLGLAARPAHVWDHQDFQRIMSKDYDDLYVSHAGWVTHDLMAIGQGELSLFINRMIPADFGEIQGEREERWTVAEFGHGRQRTEDLFEGKLEFESGFATNQMLYVWSGNGVTGLAIEGELHKRLREVRHFELPVTSIYDGFSFAGGLVFDTDRGTFHASPGGRSPSLISEQENVSARAFTQARYYDRQVWSVKENRIDIAVIPSAH